MSSGRARWYVRRLARMSAREIVHRLGEQGKRTWDSRTKRRWSEFGHFEGPLLGLPGIVPLPSGNLKLQAMRQAELVRQRSFKLLNCDWPRTEDWDALWHLDPVTQTRWPGKESFAFEADFRHVGDKGDVKFVWEINRLQFLPVLALAGETELFSQVLASWMKANPPFQGINWSSGIEAASRVVSLLAALALFADDAKAQLGPAARCFLDAHVAWIRRYPSLYSSANNHRVAELVAQFLCGVCAPELPQAAELLEECRAELERRMQGLFRADGVGAEQSVTYATYALEWFALAGLAGDCASVPFSAAYRARAAAAAGHLRWLMDDIGRTPSIGDDDGTRVLAMTQEPENLYTASVVALVARWLNAPELLPPARDPELRDLWGRPGVDGPGTLPIGMKVFADGGYTVFRQETPRGTLVLIFDHAPLGFESIAAHGHADALSVWLSWGDEPIVVDAGTYLYHAGGEWRDHFRGTSVHNTLCIESADQSEIAGPFNWSRHARTRLVEHSEYSATAEHDGYLRNFGLLHRRAVTSCSPGDIAINDAILGAPQRSLRWRIAFVLAAGTTVSETPTGKILKTARGRVLAIGVEPEGTEQATERVRFSPSFGRLEEAQMIVFSGVVAPDKPLHVATRIKASWNA